MTNAGAISEQVYQRIEAAIVGLELEPGQALSESYFTRKLDVSRTPVRESLQRLQREGLVLVLPQRGTFVAPLSGDVIRSSFFIRLSLEKSVAMEAANLRTEADITHLRAAIALQEKAIAQNDRDLFFQLNEDFHAQLTYIADLPIVETVIAGARKHLKRFRAAHLEHGGPYPLHSLLEEHIRIVDAIAGGDPARAEDAMRVHIERALPRFELIKKMRPDFFALPGQIAGSIKWSAKSDQTD